jgi:hypothetical protein
MNIKKNQNFQREQSNITAKPELVVRGGKLQAHHQVIKKKKQPSPSTKKYNSQCSSL